MYAAAVPTAWSVTGDWASATAVLLILAAIFCALASARQARALTRMQSDFVTNVSHQLKTPLSVLSGASQTLYSRRLQAPEKLTAYHELIRLQVSRLSRLVEQILMFARVDMGSALSTRRVDMKELVKRCVDDFRRDLTSDDLSMDLEVVGDRHVVEGNPDSLEQVVLNLVDNAVKYGRIDSPNHVVVRLETKGSDLVISVRDRGIGIEPSEKARIFAKFYRGEQAQRTKGFGLGLAIVQSIVFSHHGSVNVSSAVGVGSEFRVTLPLSETVQ
jgi:two-component system phosphate regulon sensor histidine kinase PhoR